MDIVEVYHDCEMLTDTLRYLHNRIEGSQSKDSTELDALREEHDRVSKEVDAMENDIVEMEALYLTKGFKN